MCWIIADLNGEKMVLINDIYIKDKKRKDWKEAEGYLKEYGREFYKIVDRFD